DDALFKVVEDGLGPPAASEVRGGGLVEEPQERSPSRRDHRGRQAAVTAPLLDDFRRDRSFLAAGHQEDHAPGGVDRAERVRNSASAGGGLGDLDDQVPGLRERDGPRKERSGVAVLAEAEQPQLEPRRAAGETAPERLFISAGGPGGFRLARDPEDSAHRDPERPEELVMRHPEVRAFGVRRHGPLVSEEEADAIPSDRAAMGL